MKEWKVYIILINNVRSVIFPQFLLSTYSALTFLKFRLFVTDKMHEYGRKTINFHN